MCYSFGIVALVSVFMGINSIDSHVADNTCTFQVKHKVFSLVAINLAGQNEPYYKIHKGNSSLYYNFCEPFVPPECLNLSPALPEAYSYVVAADSSANLTCTPYTSDSKTANFRTSYVRHDEGYHLNLSMTLPLSNQT